MPVHLQNLNRCAVLVALLATFGPRPVFAQDAADDGAAASLQQLKREGAQRSSYLRREVRPVNAEKPQPSLAVFREQVQPVLEQKCLDCHGPDVQEGNIRIDTLDPDLLHGDDVQWWLEVMAVLSNEEMPPADAESLGDEDRSRIVQWLSQELQIASTVRRAEQGHSSFRRMTRYEYNYALQDLLGLPDDFAKDLPPEPSSEDGFLNSSEMLHMSAIQFAAYRELGRKALLKATVRGPQPEPLYWGVSMKDASAKAWTQQEEELEKVRQQHKDDPERLKRELERRQKSFTARHGAAHYKNLESEATARINWRYPGARYAWAPQDTRPAVPDRDGFLAILPARQKMIVELGDRIPDEGALRIRVRAARSNVEQRPPRLQLEFGWQASNDSSAVVRVDAPELVVEAPPEQPEFYEWEIPVAKLQPRNLVRRTNKLGDLPSPSEYIKLVNSSSSPADIEIDYVEVIGPVYDSWPPASHQRIFFASASREDEAVYGREVLARFMSRAWRRAVTEAEVDQKWKLFEAIRPQCDDFQEAMVEVLATVIASPKFLYLAHATSPKTDTAADSSRLSDSELATRLSMFLWCSLPDQQLRKLAAEGRLSDAKVLAEQVERMLSDPRSERFAEQFTRQWLGMQLLDYLNVDRKHYPAFEPSLKEAMQREPIEFFRELLRTDASVLDFLHADYTMANQRLARHYGLTNVYGDHFRRVALPADSHRGGLLTQAGLLAMNSDGKDSHPLKRGIWMLERLLNDPPPPPPPAVPEIDLADPEIAKLTLKERIENHRNQASCRSCHAKIDPWGIAFENFDAVGSWRTQVQGRPVDASSMLFNNEKLDGMDGLKRFLLTKRQDQFARAMVHKMSTFALGRPLTFSDRAEVDAITAEVRRRGDGLATMVKQIVASELFQAR